MMPAKTVDVFYHGKSVGSLAQMPDKRVAFQYSDSWLKDGFSISPFSLPLRDEVFIPKDHSRDIFRGLFGVFADSLPDSWGQLLLDRRLASIGIDPGSITVLDRLAYVGDSGMGALEYHPAKDADFSIDYVRLNYDEIASECSKVLSSRPADISSDQLDVLYGLAGSSGGTRPKILLQEKGEDWIVKFPAGNDPSICGKREYDYSVCAGKCGIVMSETQLAASRLCGGYFKTKRFDREGSNKIFSITFTGLLETDFRVPSCDYSTYMKLIQILTRNNIHDLRQMYLLMCFNVLAHNRDDHTKNFSFLYTADNGWRLAPAYDLTFSDTYFGEQTTSVNGKGRNITDDDLIRIGADAGFSKKQCKEMLDTVRKETAALREYM